MFTNEKLTTTLALVSLMLAGCASSPDDIDAAYVSPLKYKDYDCDQLAMEMDYVGQRTTKLYQRLEDERNADNWQMGLGFILWPIWLGLEGGDGPEAAEYAQLKGEYEALRENSVTKKCGIESKSPEEIIKEAEGKGSSEENAEDAPLYGTKVHGIAEHKGCSAGIELVKKSAETEIWAASCDEARTLTIKCDAKKCSVTENFLN